MSVELRITRTMNTSADHAWRALTDWPEQGRWMPFTTVRVVRGIGRSVGDRIEAWTGIGRFGFLDTMTITRWEPPRRCEVLHTGRVVRGPGIFAVEPLDDRRCRVEWIEHLDLPLGKVGRAGWLVAAPAVRAGLGLALRRFAAYAGQR